MSDLGRKQVARCGNPRQDSHLVMVDKDHVKLQWPGHVECLSQGLQHWG